MTLIAKPVIDKQFWILQENNRKVGLCRRMNETYKGILNR